MATLQEHLEGNCEEEWRRAGVLEQDIAFSRLSGIDARDVRTFRDFSLQPLLIIVRNPKVTARAWHGLLPPKSKAIEKKTGDWGVVVTDDRRRMYVSDYDLMCVWRTTALPPVKVFISAAHGAARGRWTPEAVALVVQLNSRLVSKIQHGCQDDYQSTSNPGVKPSDHFSAFHRGVASHLNSTTTCAAFYAKHKISWPYAASGKYSGPIAAAT